jgi:hypothetical protein
VHKSIKLVLLFLLAGVAAAGNAQTPPSAPTLLKHYKVDFVVKEADASGHVTNSRSYSTVLATTNQNDPNQIRSGDRVPIRVGLNDKGDNNLQYVDIGVSFDCRYVQEIDQKLAMKIKAEISSLPAGADLNAGIDPLIRQFQWNSDVLVPTGVPTTIFSSDDVNSKTRMQVGITATLIK